MSIEDIMRCPACKKTGVGGFEKVAYMVVYVCRSCGYSNIIKDDMEDFNPFNDTNPQSAGPDMEES